MYTIKYGFSSFKHVVITAGVSTFILALNSIELAVGISGNGVVINLYRVSHKKPNANSALNSKLFENNYAYSIY